MIPGPFPDELDAALERIVRAAGVELAADRCWLYARDPPLRRGIAAVRWLRGAAIADVPTDLRDWAAEAPDLPAVDPLFARALAGQPLDSVDDARRGIADPAIEGALGQRAFVHVNLHVDGVLWGTFQPGMTDAPRRWSAADRALLAALRPGLAELVRALVRRRGRALSSRLLVGPAPEA